MGTEPPALLTFWPPLVQDALAAPQAPVGPGLFCLCWGNMELLQLLGVLRVGLLGLLGVPPASQLPRDTLGNLPRVGTNSRFNGVFTGHRTFKYST